jgi:hypothetical protein
VTLACRGSCCAEGANTSWERDWRIIGTKGAADKGIKVAIENCAMDGN